jgi:threonine/homoserine/homoserine lactone efflux protein
VLDPAVLPGFLIAVLLVVVAPGPDNAYIIAVALHLGPRAGVLSAAGMALGMVVHVTAAAVGLALLLGATPWALDAVRLTGGAYLGWLAVDTLRGARRVGPHGEVDRPSERLVLRRAVLTNLTNPKVILFFAAFLPQFVRAGHGPTSAQLLTLGLIFLLVGLAVDATIGVAAGRAGAALAPGGRAATALAVAAGLTFATLAAVLVGEFLRDVS